MTIIGGLRDRLILDNIYNLVNDSLTELGWMDENRDHKSISIRTNQIDDDESAEPNIIVVSSENVISFEAELGSKLTEDKWDYYVDVFAEDDTFGKHIGGDIRDILKGKFTSSVSRVGPTIEIYDLSQDSATPIPVFSVDIENVDLDKSRSYEKSYERFWYVISFTVIDTYGTEEL